MKGYKGFDKGMICRGKQYSENTVFEEDSAVICESGMHFCERPIDVLRFYDPVNGIGEMNDFAEVEALDEVKTDDNIKFCTKKLKVGAKIGILGLIKAEVEYVKENLIPSADEIKELKGNCSAAVNSGDRSAAVNSGDSSASVNSGDRSAAEVSGKESVAISIGVDGRAKGKKGCWLTIAEWVQNKSGKFHRKNVKTVKVDGKKIKEDIWYTLKNGKFVEVE